MRLLLIHHIRKTIAFHQHILLIVLAGLLSFGGNLLIAKYRGIPVPYIHDEFSYLLAADTFAHGRLTNPSHPLWKSFETFYVLQQPTYMSKYPPGQGFFMAIGQVLFGHPIYGVWISSALMCAAITWMLYAWVPTFWGFMGGLIAVLQFGVFTYWSQSYWGGAVAALGGAVVFGALSRIFKHQRMRDAVWLGIGLMILAISRPVEGIIIGIPVGCLVLPWKIQWKKIDVILFVRHIMIPFVVVLSLTIIFIGYYNKAITGNPFECPYLLYTKLYRSVPIVLWQPLRPDPSFNVGIMKVLNEAEKVWYFHKKTLNGLWSTTIADFWRLFIFYFWSPLAVPSIIVILKILCRWHRLWRFILAVVIIILTCMSMTCDAVSHYFSSLTCLAVLLIVSGIRILAWFKIRKMRIGIIFVICLFIYQFTINISRPFTTFTSYGRLLENHDGQGMGIHGSFTREGLKKILLKKGRKYLIIVRYTPSKYPDAHLWNEWVYNNANIDQSPIIWARDMGKLQNAKLFAYFKDREVLWITVGGEKPLVKKFWPSSMRFWS